VSDGHWTDTGNLFRVLADIDFQGASPVYERLARAAADDTEIVALLDAAAPVGRDPMRAQVLAVAGAHVAWLAWLDRASGRPRS
jgi:hypothetical protein